jgi:hypothetical protein
MNKKDIEIVENLYKHYVRKAISFAMTYVHDKVFFPMTSDIKENEMIEISKNLIKTSLF